MDPQFCADMAAAHDREANGWDMVRNGNPQGYTALGKASREQAAAWRSLAGRLPIPMSATFRSGS